MSLRFGMRKPGFGGHASREGVGVSGPYISAPIDVVRTGTGNPPAFNMNSKWAAPGDVQVGDIPQVQFDSTGTIYSGTAVATLSLDPPDFSGAGLPTLSAGSHTARFRYNRGPGTVVGAWSTLASFTIAASAPTISITSGSGYAGSTYTSTAAGQWTADGTNISGETGATYIISAANEGKAIRCNGSNAIEMWVPTDDANCVVWIDPETGVTQSAGAVSALVDRTTGKSHVQATGGVQPTIGVRTQNSLALLTFTEDSLVGSYGNPVTGVAFTQITLMARNAAMRGDSYAASTDNFVSGESVLHGFGSDTFIRGGVIGQANIDIAISAFSARDWWLSKHILTASGRSLTVNDGTPSTNGTTSFLSGSRNIVIGSGNGVIPNYYGLSNNDIAEQIWTKSTDTTTLEKHEGYMAHRRALTSKLRSGHAYKSVPPYITAP